MEKIKENIKSSIDKAKSYIQGNYHRLSVDFSAETPQARREWNNLFKIMKG